MLQRIYKVYAVCRLRIHRSFTIAKRNWHLYENHWINDKRRGIHGRLTVKWILVLSEEDNKNLMSKRGCKFFFHTTENQDFCSTFQFYFHPFHNALQQFLSQFLPEFGWKTQKALTDRCKVVSLSKIHLSHFFHVPKGSIPFARA